MKPTFYVTTPIYYVNGAPHVGHVYTSIACDVLARWKRLDGYDVFFLTGTDEHGQKVEKAARDAGVAPQSFVDGVARQFREAADLFGISYDDFIRTTEQRHKDGCAEIWRRMAANGDVYLGAYEGWYAVRDEAYYGEDELIAGLNGSKIAPTGAPVEWVREPSYFFRLSAYADKLLQLYESQPDFVSPPSRRNEVVSFVRGGLRDLSISRSSFKWGVPVPDDPDHVMYVWIDALANYVTAMGYPDEASPRWRYWPADVHVVGKEIVRFHAVYWPAMLMSAGVALPRRVFSNGWWTFGGEKMSKSLGNVIDPHALARTFGVDPVRFFVLREVPFGNDGDFNTRGIVSRMNVELANDLGNLAQRTLSLIARNCDGRMPARNAATEDDVGLLAATEALPALVRERLERLAFGEALEEIWKVIRACNGYIDRQAPWALRRTDPERMGCVLRVLCDALRMVATLLQPFMPASMANMLDQLGVAADARTVAALAYPFATGSLLPSPVGVFPRFVDDAA
ncbi:MAG: methionine--tRNA ligase [Acetobacteraceae bacterium]|nr:methionine--tRNA ligase [Acetobacteraceae bacterium]